MSHHPSEHHEMPGRHNLGTAQPDQFHDGGGIFLSALLVHRIRGRRVQASLEASKAEERSGEFGLRRSDVRSCWCGLIGNGVAGNGNLGNVMETSFGPGPWKLLGTPSGSTWACSASRPCGPWQCSWCHEGPRRCTFAPAVGSLVYMA